MAEDGMHFLIIDSPYYVEIAEELLAGATEALTAAGATYERLSVPGVLEIPAALSMATLAAEDTDTDYAGYVVLGCVIRGETSHYDIVANESARAIVAMSVNEVLAIGNGILTVDSAEQAWARAKRDQKNKGGVAAQAALHMARLKAKTGRVRVTSDAPGGKTERRLKPVNKRGDGAARRNSGALSNGSRRHRPADRRRGIRKFSPWERIGRGAVSGCGCGLVSGFDGWYDSRTTHP